MHGASLRRLLPRQHWLLNHKIRTRAAALAEVNMNEFRGAHRDIKRRFRTEKLEL